MIGCNFFLEIFENTCLMKSLAMYHFMIHTYHVFFTDPWWLTTIVSSIGKFSITAAFGIMYIFTNELFPTVVRNFGMGSASLFGRLGSLIAPFMREMVSAKLYLFFYSRTLLNRISLTRIIRNVLCIDMKQRKKIFQSFI